MIKMQKLKKIIWSYQLLLPALLVLQACSWPYKSSFSCPVPRGEVCKSLYEVSLLADSGKYDPNSDDQKLEQEQYCLCKKKH